MYKYLNNELDELNSLFKKTDSSFKNNVTKLSDLAVNSINNKGKIIFCGNGGSAADSQHLAAELVVRFEKFRKSIPALALTVDTSIITACANDYSYDEIFSRQVESLGKKEDLLICISTSGASKNIHKVAKTARDMGIKTVLLSSIKFANNNNSDLYNLVITVPSLITSTIQTSHIMIGHALCREIESQLLT